MCLNCGKCYVEHSNTIDDQVDQVVDSTFRVDNENLFNQTNMPFKRT